MDTVTSEMGLDMRKCVEDADVDPNRISMLVGKATGPNVVCVGIEAEKSPE